MFPSKNTWKNAKIWFDLDLWQWPWPLITSVIVWKGRPGTKPYITVFELTEYLSPVRNKSQFSEFTYFVFGCHGNAICESCPRVPKLHHPEFDSVCSTDAKTAKTYLLTWRSHFRVLAAGLVLLGARVICKMAELGEKPAKGEVLCFPCFSVNFQLFSIL